MRKKLEKKAGKNIQFFGRMPWNEVEKKIYESRALIFPGEEDFGMIPLEVMALGVPVIAYAKGGALETVIENRKRVKESTGLFFKKQTTASLRTTLDEFKSIENEFDADFIRIHASSFKEENFLNAFKKTVNTFLGEN
jgi:glycosyltransferase involved in cell wall biosynthesis